MNEIQKSLRTIDTNENQSTSVCLHLTLPSFSYGIEKVLGELELKIYSGETIAITGRSGIGKTTLIRILAGLETNHAGKQVGSPKLGYVFQEPTLLPWRTVSQNLCLIANIDEQQALSALKEVGLHTKSEMFPNQLSLGQQRRLALARAFAVEPDLLLMDEPYVSLDAELANEMMDLFDKLRTDRSMSTVFITHSQQEIERLATRTLTLSGNPAKFTIEKCVNSRI